MDKKTLNEQIIKDYLKELSPLEAYPEPEKYPSMDTKYIQPRWFRYETDSFRQRKHQYHIIPYKYSKNGSINKTKELLKNLPYQQ
jgi:hypothetical protein